MTHEMHSAVVITLFILMGISWSVFIVYSINMIPIPKLDRKKERNDQNMFFENVDKKLKDIGFIKTQVVAENGIFVLENKYGVSYERENKELGYTQVLDILHKRNGNHIIQSYQKGVNKNGLNNVVGLNYEEMKLAMKKYRQLKRRYRWG